MTVRVSFVPAEQQLEVIHGFLAQSYWSPGIKRETVEQALANSITASAFDGDAQIGMARVVTDRTTMAYLADVFVLEPYRGRGVARSMIEALYAHPDLVGLRRWFLFTRDMQPVYARLGWQHYEYPDRLMILDNPDAYQ